MRMLKHFSEIEVQIDERVPAMIEALDNIQSAKFCPECNTFMCEHNSIEETVAAMKWKNCTDCMLHAGRQTPVFATGNKVNPKLFIIGGSPDEIEDSTGKAFTGKYSNQLNGVLTAAGIDRNKDCCLTNALSCRSWIPGTKKEIAAPVKSMTACRPRLIEEYYNVQDSTVCIVLLGKEAYISWMLSQEMKSVNFDPNTVRIEQILGWHWIDHMSPVYVVESPSRITRRNDPALAQEWLDDWKSIALLMKTGEITEPRKGHTS